jgi:signal transduction histidine kinase
VVKFTPFPSSFTPALTLAGLFTAAALVLGAGLWLSRKETPVREPVDRSALRNLIEALGTEISRLDTLYAQHLSELGRETGFTSQNDLVRRCQEVQGIKLHSLLVGPRPEDALHYEIPAQPIKDGTAPLQPLSPARAWTVARTVADLAANKIFAATPADAARQGWEWVRGADEAVYWEYKGPRTGVAFTLDVKTIQATTEEHMRQWLQPRMHAVLKPNDQVRIESPWQTSLYSPSELPSDQMPDIAAPLPGRWGHWQVQAWDRVTMHRHLDGAILGGTSAISGLLAFLGIGLAHTQRRAHHHAAQRVSFVNRVSHELATPLTNMLLNLDLAREDLTRDPPTAERRLDLVEEETRRLSRLTDNVLTFSRASRGALQLHARHCVPDELVEHVLSQFQPALTRAGVTVLSQFDAHHAVLMDADAFVQITANLVSNVEKYAACGEILHLTTHWHGGSLTLSVGDQGPGIPAAAVERIFQPFERLARHTSEGTSGTGLGLAISRELAHSMGGVLQLTTPSSGAEFVLVIPAPEAT